MSKKRIYWEIIRDKRIEAKAGEPGLDSGRSQNSSQGPVCGLNTSANTSVLASPTQPLKHKFMCPASVVSVCPEEKTLTGR